MQAGKSQTLPQQKEKTPVQAKTSNQKAPKPISSAKKETPLQASPIKPKTPIQAESPKPKPPVLENTTKQDSPVQASSFKQETPVQTNANSLKHNSDDQNKPVVEKNESQDKLCQQILKNMHVFQGSASEAINRLKEGVCR